MSKAYTGNPHSSPAPRSPGQNGALPAPGAGLGDLANFVAQVDAQAAEQTEDVQPLPPVKGDPEPVADPAPPDDGQTPAEGDEQTPATPAEGGDDAVQTDLSHTENADLTEALKGLNADAQKHLIEMAQAVASGEANIGQLKRGHKIAEEFRAQIDELKAQVEDLSQRGTRSAERGTNSSLPPEIARLNTLAEVEEKMTQAKAAVRFLEDFLDDNPNGGEINGQTYSRQEIKAKKRAWQDDLEQLPRQAVVLQQRQQAQVQRSSARLELERDYPWFKETTHPDVKAVKDTLKANPWMNDFPSPEYVAALWNRGQKAMVDELTARKTGKPAATTAPKPPAGKVPLGKPHATTAAVPAKTGGDASARSALSGVMEKGDRASLAKFLAATGR